MAGNDVNFILSSESGLSNISLTIGIACTVVVLTVFWLLKKKRGNGPPGPIGIPFLGYVPFLGSEPHRVLHDLRKRYGSVFSLYLGRNYVVILGDYEAMKEGLGKSSTTNRPTTSFDFIPDGIGFSSINGEDWVEQRRYCMKAMRDLGMGKNVWESLVQEEVEDFVKSVSTLNGRPFSFCKLLTASVGNNILSLVFGKRLPLNERAVEFLYQSATAAPKAASKLGLRNTFPFLFKIFSKLGISKYGSYNKQLEDFNHFVRDQVREHKTEEQGSEDFVHAYLKKMEYNKENGITDSFNDTNLYGNIQALFIGASDTTEASITWLLLTMAKYLDIQKKVHEEIDSVLGREGKIQWSDKNSVPFTVAVIMEGQRWITIAPLNSGRLALEDIKLGGYHIPKCTTIIANYWGMHNDEKYWKNPEKFQPERFLSTDGKTVNYRPESYVPFSYGKRNCPGETVAIMEILFYFVGIMQKFTVLPPEGKVPNMRGITSLTYQAETQELRFVER